MKKLFPYLLLLCFVIQCTSQVWIITRFYVQREYIANNLCINRFDAVPVCKGQCYLNQELTEHEKKQEQQLPDIKQKEVQLFAENNINVHIHPVYHLHSETLLSSEPDFTPSGFIFSVFHPPKQA